MTSHLSALDLLKLGDGDRTKPWANYYWAQILGIGLGTATGCFINYQTRRPPFSGIQKHVLAAGGYTALFSYIIKKREEYLSEKDAIYRHYVELHPEDFPTPERKLIGDIFEPWIPVR